MPPCPPVVYVDDHLLVIDKPAGMLSVPGRGEANADCASARVQASYADALIVHRLDMSTSGLLLFARGLSMQRQLGKAFENRAISKRYVAVVHGVVEAPETADGWMLIDLPINADWPNRPRQRIDHEGGKPSRTSYRVIDGDANEANDTYDTDTRRARLELEPVTGRTHQLRVHLAAIGHPIVGDMLYGPPTTEPRLMLHAAELCLAHPATGAGLHFRAPLPF